MYKYKKRFKKNKNVWTKKLHLLQSLFPLVLFMFLLLGSDGSNISFTHSFLLILNLKKKRELNGVLVNRGDSYSRKFLDKLKEHMLPCAGLFHILHSSLKERLFLNCMVGKGGFPFQSLQTERWVINTAAAHRISVNRIVAQGFTGNNSLELFCYTVFYS